MRARDKITVLDAYCGAGGAGAGYARAGFVVTGVDKADHSRHYPFTFVQADAVDYIAEHGHKFDLIHTSPPCQGQIAITKGNRKRPGWTDTHRNLIPATRDACERTGRPYVIENGPSEHIRSDVVLCGLSFGLPVFRHRAFELGGWRSPREPHVSHAGHLTLGWRHGCLRTPASAPETCPLHRTWCEGTVYGIYGKGGSETYRDRGAASAGHRLDGRRGSPEPGHPARVHRVVGSTISRGSGPCSRMTLSWPRSGRCAPVSSRRCPA